MFQPLKKKKEKEKLLQLYWREQQLSSPQSILTQLRAGEGGQK